MNPTWKSIRLILMQSYIRYYMSFNLDHWRFILSRNSVNNGGIGSLFRFYYSTAKVDLIDSKCSLKLGTVWVQHLNICFYKLSIEVLVVGRHTWKKNNVFMCFYISVQNNLAIKRIYISGKRGGGLVITKILFLLELINSTAPQNKTLM